MQTFPQFSCKLTGYCSYCCCCYFIKMYSDHIKTYQQINLLEILAIIDSLDIYSRGKSTILNKVIFNLCVMAEHSEKMKKQTFRV